MTPLDRYKESLLWVSRMQELEAEVNYSARECTDLREKVARFFKEATEAKAKALVALNESILSEHG